MWLGDDLLTHLYSIRPISYQCKRIIGYENQLHEFWYFHNNLTKDDVINQASDLSFPNSVIDMMQGGLGWPEGGFPEPLRTQIVGDRDTVVGRPGENLDDVNFLQIQRDLNKAGFQFFISRFLIGPIRSQLKTFKEIQ